MAWVRFREVKSELQGCWNKGGKRLKEPWWFREQITVSLAAVSARRYVITFEHTVYKEGGCCGLRAGRTVSITADPKPRVLSKCFSSQSQTALIYQLHASVFSMKLPFWLDIKGALYTQHDKMWYSSVTMCTWRRAHKDLAERKHVWHFALFSSPERSRRRWSGLFTSYFTPHTV